VAFQAAEESPPTNQARSRTQVRVARVTAIGRGTSRLSPGWGNLAGAGAPRNSKWGRGAGNGVVTITATESRPAGSRR
jgi:hypothetical protein